MSFVVRQAGQGTAYDFDGARFVMKASGAETGGQFAVMEVLSPAGLQVPPHVHMTAKTRGSTCCLAI